MLNNAQNPLDTFPRNFPICQLAADLLATWQTILILTCQAVANKSTTSRCNGIWETTDTTDTTDFCSRQLVTDLLRICCLCYGLVTDLLQGKLGNWFNGFWPLQHTLEINCAENALYDGRLRAVVVAIAEEAAHAV